MGEILKASHLSFAYDGKDKPVLNDINLSINEGEFVLLAGPTGCGKSTLLRELISHEKPGKIGFVSQDPDACIVADKVYHDIAFGPENLGLTPDETRLRVAESAGIFGFSEHITKEIKTLSGGQKQMLALCSALAAHPRLLILDEPCSMLDPVSARKFMDILTRLNRDMGVTVLLCEHRLDMAFSLCERALYMEDGAIAFDGSVKDMAEYLISENKAMAAALPAGAQIAGTFGYDIPLNVRDGKDMISDICAGLSENSVIKADAKPGKENEDKAPYAFGSESKASCEPSFVCDGVYFRYKKDLPDVLKNFSLELYPGETTCIIGENGCGKSTASGIMAGIMRPYRGRTKLFGKDMSKISRKDLYNDGIAYLPQSPEAILNKETVLSELLDVGNEEEAMGFAQILGLSDVLNMHPYDLSFGMRQELALAKIMLLRPKVLIMDEPAKGMDAAAKMRLSEVFKELKKQGASICMVSHDLEFCAQTADMCGLLFDGRIISLSTRDEFFGDNYFYTTQTQKIAGKYLPGCLTPGEAIKKIMEIKGGGRNEL